MPVVDAALDELTLIVPTDGGGGPNYAREARYAETREHARELEGGWEHFRHELKHRPRLFNADAKQFLDRLLRDTQPLRTQGKRGSPVLRTVKPDEATLLFRARRAPRPGNLERILSSPGEQLGPPPPECAPAGRMNSAGVTAFYGAFDRETCIAELRPCLGDTVVSGAFRLRKPLRLLDFPLLEQCYREQPLSYFQPDFKRKSACRHFLRRLHSKMRHPPQPDDEAELLSTQVFAEYLSGVVKPSIDGVVYASAQREGGLNVVLFSHVLDIQLPTERPSVMGTESALRICDDSAMVHRISAIHYRCDHRQAQADGLELSLDPHEFPDDDE
ncbi:RES family NAD+ phosphorylase [Methylogaea oryzae]|uniref:RES family NAD+ phosphorylase n=1 Tax=Methylogaea oryzae TaxID=1295382 RepID=UPI0006D12866|nr:RES family NAD+ phosphorylase [Methylogaea oryzae]